MVVYWVVSSVISSLVELFRKIGLVSIGGSTPMDAELDIKAYKSQS